MAREIFDSLELREELKSYDNKIDAALQTRMRVEMRTLVERASRWLVTNRRPPLDSLATVTFFDDPIQAVITKLPELMSGRELAAYESRKDSLVADGVPEELASKVAVLPPAYMLLNIIEIADRESWDADDVARVHFALGERLGLPTLVQRILALPRDDQWQTMARAALRDDLHAVHAQLTALVMRSTPADESAPGSDLDLGGLRLRPGHPGCRHPPADLRRRERRPGQDVGRPAGGAHAVVLTATRVATNRMARCRCRNLR